MPLSHTHNNENIYNREKEEEDEASYGERRRRKEAALFMPRLKFLQTILCQLPASNAEDSFDMERLRMRKGRGLRTRGLKDCKYTDEYTFFVPSGILMSSTFLFSSLLSPH